MNSSNLPPGVNVTDIPGNRPEDSADEEFLEALDRRFVEENPDQEAWGELPDDFVEPVWKLVLLARDMGYTQGRQDAENDHQLAQAFREEAEMAEQLDEGKYKVEVSPKRSSADPSVFLWFAVVYRPNEHHSFAHITAVVETKEQAEQDAKDWAETDRLNPMPDRETYTL